MTEIVIAAAPGDEAHAQAIAEALGALGFDAAADAPVDGDLAKRVEDAKCVLALWSPCAATAPLLAVQATLALERKKLVCAELTEDATPSVFAAAPRTNLDVRDRMAFKEHFEALLAQVRVLTPVESDADALTPVLMKLRAALGIVEPPPRTPLRWRPLAGAGVLVVALFALGYGARRVWAELQAHPFLVASSTAAAAPPAPATATPAALPAPRVGVRYGLTRAELETLPWREAAARIDPAQAARIKTDAAGGDAFAQSVACLAHMSGVAGFLPSPTAASEFCNAAAAQNDPAALYLSWVLARSTPHAAIPESVARERLAEAARRGLTTAQIDYALVLAPDGRAPAAAQVEAGRLWLAAAERGDARGQFYYARWLRDSPAGPRDPSTAIPYLQRAADAGQLDALHMLATLYRDGVGAPRDTAHAKALYERAAARDFAPSMFNLADLVRTSERERAIALYRQLACMRDEHQISVISRQRLRAMGQTLTCA